MSERIIIGIDCATDPRKVGLACGVSRERGLLVEAVGTGGPGMVDTIARWIGERDALLAIDSPLGWPCTMGAVLSDHTAGGPLDTSLVFNRETDRIVHRVIGRKPLDVGSDRIARTARAALLLLEQLRAKTGRPIPLAWDPGQSGLAAIEVYPTATLSAHGLPFRAYKKPDQSTRRSAILDALSDIAEIGKHVRDNVRTADEVDAIVCALAGHDFLRAPVITPDDLTVAQKEGWIWVKA